jgi:hypothetical protein
MNEAYKKQVGLLLDVLPEVAKEAFLPCMAARRLISLYEICQGYRWIST